MLAVALLALGSLGWTPDPPEGAHTDRFTVTEPVRRVEVEIAGGSVALTGGGDRVEVERTLRYRGRTPPTARHAITDQVLRLEARCAPGSAVQGWNCTADHVVRVPPSVSVAIHTGSGEVTVRDLTGPLEIATGSGGISLSNLSGDLVADTGSGGIELEKISGAARLRSGSGGLTGKDIASGVFDTDLGSGSIDVAHTVAPGELRLKTGSGGISALVPKGPYNLDLHSGSGDPAVHDRGVVDDPAAGRRIVADSGSGSVTVHGR